MPKVEAAKRPVDERVGDWREVYERQDPHAAGRRGVAAGPPLHGLRNPVLPLGNCGLSAGQPHPRVERPGPAGPVGCGERPPARHQQLPGVHRPAVPGAVRGGLRAVHRRGADRRQRHDQAHRADHRRPGLDGRHRRTAARRHLDGQERRRRRLRARGTGCRTTTHPRRARRHRLRARRPHRRPDALRHPRVQAGEGDAEPAAGPNASGGNPFRHRLRGRRRPDRRAAARAVRRRRARGRCAARPRQRRRGPAPRRACTWRWSTWCPPTRSARATARQLDLGQGQARRDHRRRRHRRGLPRHRAPAGRERR